MLEIRNLSWLAPDGRKVLDNISLDIPDGKLVVITGPNGSGKTTLARVIAGMETATGGNIILNGIDITDFDVTRRANSGISFALQQPVRFKGITVRQLIEIAAGGKRDERQLCEILSRVGLCAKDYLGREINSTLSGGEIKRIEIATVIARNTGLSIFDEPEAGIDLWSFKNLIEVFKKMHEKLDGTIVIISHQERILKIADEIIILSNGKIESFGSRDEMLPRVLNSESAMSGACCRKEAIFNE